MKGNQVTTPVMYVSLFLMIIFSHSGVDELSFFLSFTTQSCVVSPVTSFRPQAFVHVASKSHSLENPCELLCNVVRKEIAGSRVMALGCNVESVICQISNFRFFNPGFLVKGIFWTAAQGTQANPRNHSEWRRPRQEFRKAESSRIYKAAYQRGTI